MLRLLIKLLGTPHFFNNLLKFLNEEDLEILLEASDDCMNYKITDDETDIKANI